MEDDCKKGGVGYWLLYVLVYLHALLPFWVLYILSDFLYLIAYHVVRYRRKLVKKNLKNSFPEKSDSERLEIERRFYRHFCDYIVETLKTLRISNKEIRKRMKFENPEMINRLVKESGSCLLCLGHYANWEWVPSIGMYLLPGVKTGLIYKQLRSDAFDRLLLKIRSRFYSLPIEKRRMYRTMIKARDEKQSVVVGLLSDQRLPKHVNEYLTRFLNQDTLIDTGMEKIARSLALPVVYIDLKKVKRGHYSGRFFVITPDASIEPQYAVTERYTRKMENTILNDPAYYLWTHDRWKFMKEMEQSGDNNRTDVHLDNDKQLIGKSLPDKT